eukprot:gene1030-3891_t
MSDSKLVRGVGVPRGPLPRHLHALFLFLATLAPALAQDSPGSPDDSSDDWFNSTDAVTIKWLMIFIISPIGLVFLILISLSILELRNLVPPPTCGNSYKGVNVFGLLWWPLVFGISVYEVAEGQTVVVVFLVWSVICTIAHGVLVALYVRRDKMRRTLDNPKKELLVNQERGGNRPSHMDEENPAPQLESPTFNPPTYGLLPGTNTGAYQIFLPIESPMSHDFGRGNTSMMPQSSTHPARMAGIGITSPAS